jgi:methyl-accepting chemotaxis protein
MLLQGVFALYSMASMHKVTENIDKNTIPSLQHLAALNLNVMRMRVFTLRLLIAQNELETQSAQEAITDIHRNIATIRQAYEPLISVAGEQESYEQFSSSYARYSQLKNDLSAFVAAKQQENAVALANSELAETANQMAAALLRLNDLNTRHATEEANLSEASYAKSWNYVVAMVMLSLVIAVTAAIVLSRSIVAPVRHAVQLAEKVAGGDLTQPIEIRGKDEIAELAVSLQTMQQNLRDTIRHISNSSLQLASAAEELNMVTDNAAASVSQQNDEIQQAATAITQMSAAVEEVAQTALETSEASSQSAQSAESGKQQVEYTLAAIADINSDMTVSAGLVSDLAEQSQHIGKALDVIRAVAEQTNLLALNAAIEAARAGDAGRGFAVVADEVRALAHRTQSSTKEIETMVQTIRGGTQAAVLSMQHSKEKAELALQQAQKAGGALDTIALQINQISDRNHVVASAAEQQAKVAREVDRNIINISDLATQTATGAHQTSAAAHDLSRLAVDLNTLVVRFTV